MFIPDQLTRLLPGPADERVASADVPRPLALLDEHVPELGARPSVPRHRAQRRDQHARGNINWMRARGAELASELFGDDLDKVMPIVRPGGSDSATFDNVLELLMLGGRSLPHAVMMMIPEAYERPRTTCPRTSRLLRVPRRAHGAVGRPRRGRLHRRRASSARRSTATACAPAAGSRRTTASSSSAPRPACSTSRRPRGQAPRPPAAGQALPRRPREGADRRRRRGQARGRDPAALRRVGLAQHASTSTTSSRRT